LRRSPSFVVSVVLLAAACSSHPGDGAAPARSGEVTDNGPLTPSDGTVRVEGDPMGVVVKKLPNGLTLMLSENHEEPKIACWITTRAGSAKDPAEATGLAHYLEHMNFKGTSKLGTTDWAQEKPHLDKITALYDVLFQTTDPAKRKELYNQIDAENQAATQFEVMNEFDTMYSGMGFQGLNAFTSTDQTSYVCEIPANRLESWAKVESDRFRDPVYRLFQSELEAVYEEKNRGMDNKSWGPREAMMADLFPQHPYGTQTTIGTIEHLKNPSLTKIYDYFHKWYVPGNMVVTIAGDFKTADALAVLEKYFGTWEGKPVPPDPVHPIVPLTSVVKTELKFEAEEQLLLAWLTVAPTDPDADALIMADMMLANGSTGLIDVDVNQKQRLVSAGASPEFLVEAGGEILSAVPKSGQTLEDAEKLLLAEIERLKKGAFDDADMRGALTQFEIQRKQQLESSDARVREMTESYVNREGWERKVHALDRLRTVSKDDIVRVANKYFGPNYVAVYRRSGKPEVPSIAKPGFKAVDIPKDRHSEYYRAMMAAPVPPIEPRFLEADRDYKRMDLKSGKLIWSKNPSNDLFQVSFSVESGTDTDPRLGTAFGLADFGGAGDLDTLAFKKRLYELGSTVTAGAGRQETIITLTGEDRAFEETLRLAREHFDRPTGAAQADLDKLVGRVIASRAKQKIDARAVNGALGAYGQRGAESDVLHQPTNDQLKAYKAEELLAAVRDVWSHPRTVLYAGPRPIADVAAVVDLPPLGADFDALKPLPARKNVVAVTPEKPRILFVDKKATQAAVGLYFVDGVYDRPAVPTHRVYTEYMSGSMGSVVFQEIRESRSLAYDAGAGYRDGSWRGDSNIFLGALGTQADKTVEAISVLMQIVKEMPASQERMDNAKKALDEAYRTARVPFRTIPTTVLTWARLGLDGDPRPWNWEQIRKMTLADLSGWAARWKSMPYTLTIVGDKTRIDLAKLAEFGEVVEMTPDQLFPW
jgi:predicted Zn-dependent peptidase